MPQGQIEVMLSAITFEKSLEIERKFTFAISLYPRVIEMDVDGIEPMDYPSGKVEFRSGASVTLTYKVRVKGDVDSSVHLGKTNADSTSSKSILNYISVREVKDGVVVSSESTSVDAGAQEYTVEVHIPAATSGHEGRLRVEIMRVFQTTEETVTFYTDLVLRPKASIFQNKPLRIALTTCNQRSINYDTSPIQITMTRGLPNCVYCTASSYPSPTSIEFYTDHYYPVASGVSHSSFRYYKERDTMEALFSFSAVSSSHSGVYSCEARASLTQSYASVDFEIVVQ